MPTPKTSLLHQLATSNQRRVKPVKPSIPVIRCPECHAEIQQGLLKSYLIELISLGQMLTRKVAKAKRSKLNCKTSTTTSN